MEKVRDKEGDDQRPTPARAVRFVLTGFGKFNGVEDNPTTHLMKEIKEFLSTPGHQLPPHAAVESYTVLEVSAEGSNSQMQDIQASLDVPRDTIVVYLHLGVDAGCNGFKLETCAYNEARFRVPDERGWQPKTEEIIIGGGSEKRTQLPIETLLQELKRNGWEEQVAISEDAGRFVCNYTYFQTLSHCHMKNSTETKINADTIACPSPAKGTATATPGHNSLFLHVPPFASISKEAQTQFVADCLTHLSLLLGQEQR